MATNFPADIDVLVNPQPSDSVEIVPHAAQHANANDAIEALETKVGKTNDTNPNSLDFKVRTLETNILDTEEVEDLVGDLLTTGTHTNITVAYDDVARKINLTATYDNEEAIAAIASALERPLSAPELTIFPSPVVAIPVSLGSSSPVSTTTRTGNFIALAKSRSR